MKSVGKKPSKLYVTLQSLLKARGLESRLSEYRVLGRWEKAVGPAIARHALPVKLHGKRLYLTVDSPAWMQQLSLLKPEIVKKVNEALGRTAVADITLNLGEIPVSETPPDDRPVQAALDAADYETIEQYVRDISDPDVRAAVKRVIEKDILNKKAKQKR